MSFYTSLSGLKAAQTDLAVISNNVANVGSLGFKKSRTEFGDIFSSSPSQSGNVPGQGTRLKSITQQFAQGGFQNSDRALDLAVSGQGFFVTHGVGANGSVQFTRNGAFGVQDGYVVNADGAKLQVLPVDSEGNITATGLAATQDLQVPQVSGVARGTTTMKLSVSFPQGADLPANRDIYTPTTPYAFDRFDPSSYNYSTSSTVYDQNGNALPASIYYVRTSTPSDANPNSTWETHLFVGNTEVSSDPAQATPAVPLTLTFDGAGALVSPTTPVAYAPAQPSGTLSALNLTLDYGTQTAQTLNPFTLKAFQQDGVAPGKLDSLSVSSDGLVTASFSNGTTQKLGKVAVAAFANPEGLRQLGDATWGVTGTSGDPLVGPAATDGFGSIQSGALEQSNVDVTEELVALIQAQRNFQANAKAIETANQMTQIAVNLQN